MEPVCGDRLIRGDAQSDSFRSNRSKTMEFFSRLLDLPGPLPLGLKSPLALAFYWIRWLPHGDHDMSVFLPGFKAERLVHLPITSATSAAGSVWRAPLHYPSLSKSRSSIATAWVSLDGHLLRMTFELHTIYGSGRGVVEEKGCDGAPVVPVERGQ